RKKLGLRSLSTMTERPRTPFLTQENAPKAPKLQRAHSVRTPIPRTISYTTTATTATSTIMEERSPLQSAQTDGATDTATTSSSAQTPRPASAARILYQKDSNTPPPPQPLPKSPKKSRTKLFKQAFGLV
ncbi:hypothetical protein LTR66_013612, partial [Elasticomyces elasticus]